MHGGVGETIVDLTALPAPPPTARTLQVTSTAGEVVVRLPANVHVVLDAELAVGEIQVDGIPTDDGIHPHTHRDLDLGATGPPLTVHIKAGPGAIHVETTARPAVGTS